MLEIVIEIDGTKVKATAFGSRMERPAPQIIGEVADIEVFGKKIGRAVKTGKPLEAAVVEQAQHLHEALFSGEIRDLLTRLRAESPSTQVLVRLLVRNRAVQSIPWEALCQPGTSEGFLAAGTRLDLVRGVSSSEPTLPHTVQGSIRILPIAPTGDVGMTNLKSALGPALDSGKLTWLDPIVGEHASARKLFQRLRTGEPAHIIHFLGHGGVDVDGHPTLRLADDEYGDEVWIKAEMLAGELAAGFGNQLRLVVLEACEGASPGLLGSAAEILARAGAQAVIAYLWPVRAEVSRLCSEEFYRALVTAERGRGDVARSSSAARRTLLLESAAGFSPVLYLRGNDSVLFDFGEGAHRVPTTAPPPLETSRFFVPYKKNPYYVGRGAEANRLHDLLQSPSASGATIVALSGMGGIGKTLIASEYAHQYRDAYPGGVYWVNAAQDWQAELGRLGKLVGCRPSEGAGESEALRFARGFADSLRANPQSLVIFDNVDNPLELQDASLELVPARLDCKLVVTTRRRELPAAEVFVGVLPDDVALNLFLTKSRRKDGFEEMPLQERLAARAICAILDGHPLALALAGAYLEKHTRISFSGYLEGLQTEGALSVMEATRIDARLLATQHEGNVAATLNVQWKSIQGDGARLVLQTAALLTHATVIPRPRLSLLTGLSDEPQSWREAPLEEALRELSSLSLLEEFGPKEIKLHRLVRELIEKHVPDGESFAASRASALLETLWDFKRLEREVIARGIIEVLVDLNIARGLANPQDVDRLTQLIQPLDREAHCLQSLNSLQQPGFFLQQLHNQGVELGLDVVCERARAVLDAAQLPWFQQRFASCGDSPALVRTLEGHLGGAHGLAMSADGRILISAGADKTVKMWDWERGELLRTFAAHEQAANGIAITPDGRFIVSVSSDRSLRVWDVETGQCLKSSERHTNSISRVALTPDGRTCITASRDGTMRVWDLKDGQAVRTVERAIVAAGDTHYEKFAITDVTVTRDAKFAISSSEEGKIVVWDLATWRPLRTLVGHAKPVWSIAVSEDGTNLYSASEDGTIKCWNLTTGTVERTIEDNQGNVLAIAVTPDGKRIVAGLRDKTVRVWEVASGRLLHTFRGHAVGVFDVVTTLDGQHAISASTDGTIRVWRLDTEQDDWGDDEHIGGIYALTFFSDGIRFATASLDYTVKIRDSRTGQNIRTLRGHEGSVLGVAISADGRLLATASDDRTLRLWDVETGQVIRVFEGHTDFVRGVAITPDGRQLISASYDYTIRVWDIETGLTSKLFEGHTLAVRDVAITPDGRYAVSASFDKTLKIWDLVLGRLVHTLEGHLAPVWSLTITPDSRFVISGGQDFELKIWEVATGQFVRTLEGHQDFVLGIAVSPDGKWVISTSADTSMRVWDIRTGQERFRWEASWPLSSCSMSSADGTLAVGTSTGSVLILNGRALQSGQENRIRHALDHLLAEGDMIGRAALDVLLAVPRARSLFEQGGPDECEAGLLIVQTLGRASPAVDMAAAHFDLHSDASFIDYVDALGLEAMLGSSVVPTDDSFWTPARVAALRQAAFEISWQSMSDPRARLVLATVAIFEPGVPPSSAMLALFTGMAQEWELEVPNRIDEILRDVARRGWLETKLVLDKLTLRPNVQRFLLSMHDDWAAFYKARVETFLEAFSNIEIMERELARRGVAAVSGDLRVALLLGNNGSDLRFLAQRARIFGRETHALNMWDARAMPMFFLQQMRNRALELGFDAARRECESVLTRRNALWLSERFPVHRESSALSRTYRGHAAEVRCVAFRTAERQMHFVSGSDDRTVRLWDSVTGLVLMQFEGHSKAVTDVAVTSDSRYAISCSDDGTIRKWDLWTEMPAGIFEGHNCEVRRIMVDPKSRTVISAAIDGSLRVWDFQTGETLHIVGREGDPVTWIGISADGQRSIWGSPHGPLSVQHFDGNAWKQIHTLEGHTGRVNDVIMLMDARFALSASDDGTIKHWDVEKGELVRTLEGHTGPVMRVITSGDDRYAVSVSQDKTVRVWDLVAGTQKGCMRGHTDAVIGLDVCWPLGLAISASTDATLRLWTPSEPEPEKAMVGHAGAVMGLTISADGQFAISGGQDKTLRVWETSTGKLLRTLEGHRDVPFAIAISIDGKTIFVGDDGGRVCVFELTTGTLLREFHHGAPRVRGVVVTRDGRYGVSGGHDKLVRIWDAATGRVLRTLEGHTERVRAVVLTPDERHVISGGFDCSILVWDWSTGKIIRVLQGHTGAIWAIAVTPDGRYLVSASFDRTLRVWELASGRLVRTFEGHHDWVTAVAITADGRRIISTSQDTTLVIWDLHSGDRIAQIALNAAIYCGAVSSDGRFVATGDSSGAVRFIDIMGDR